MPDKSNHFLTLADQTSEFLLYTTPSGDIKVEVLLSNETIWLTQKRIAELFGVGVPAISKHLKNIFESSELQEEVVVSILENTTEHGAIVGKTQTRQVKYYNLDAVISVGYRVNSAQATQFRIWATQTLKQHLVEGHTLNQRRLQERGIEFEQALELLSKTLVNQDLVTGDGAHVLAVISDYARSWSMLQGYDEQNLQDKTSQQKEMQSLNVAEASSAIGKLKQELMAKGEATGLFGQQRSDGLASAIATIEQGFGDELFYPNVAARAAHLLYFVIKNHPFVDGNKRSASFLFLWYLHINQHLLAKPVDQLINDNTLVALALLVAESKAEQKELIIRLAEHFVLLKEDKY